LAEPLVERVLQLPSTVTHLLELLRVVVTQREGALPRSLRTASRRCSFDGELGHGRQPLASARSNAGGHRKCSRIICACWPRIALSSTGAWPASTLGACVGEILPQIALEIGAGCGEHFEPGAQIRCLPNHGIARARYRSHANERSDNEQSDDDERNDDDDREEVRHGGRVYYADV
jgi:hypothetical protein